MGKLFGVLLVLVVLLGAGAAGGWFYAQNVYTQAGPATPNGAQRTITIPPKASVQAIADKLKEGGAITDDFAFKMAARFTNTGPKLKAGEYLIDSGASLKQIIEELTEGRVLLHPVTLPEGLTSTMMMRKLSESDVLSGTLPAVIPAEGVLLPDTYKVQRGETRETVVKHMIEAQQKLIAQLWPTRQDGLPFKTAEEAIILASIVEKETGLATERPQVAAVFVNRLRRGMRLESDPTIIYGISKGEPLGHGLLRSELDRDNKWNTYQINGLPPTPICNPGADAIRAVLNPPVSGALYFVANGTGGHAFASTYSEHQKNVAAWRRIEAGQGAPAPGAPQAPATVPKPAAKPASATVTPKP